ncbi:phage tail assembly protein [Rhodopseudomonas sp. BR0G17]|uniref:phage tail assembly protein n=1 Tax=Rhodopseudomonas sp. BR0G17 TaxID=2269368 RepID=UPI0013DEA06C|nr:phage tail assembly protein [Rhodopseudomonas sp. BR0G17]NEW96904.1 phage tail assembly protein [Rhodopseudomonas sp. BR0G17]
MRDELPPPIEGAPSLKPVVPPPGSPDAMRKAGAEAGGASAEVSSVEAALKAKHPLVAVLGFRADRTKSVTLAHPFTFDGLEVSEVTVRRLTMMQVDNLVTDRRHDDLYEVFSEMTGLPAPVLRGMDCDDGDRIIAEGKDFLPRTISEAFDLP